MKNEDDEQTGEVFMWRRKGEEEFNYKLKCPYCEEEQESSVVFNKRPYRLKCSNCGKSILIEKLSSNLNSESFGEHIKSKCLYPGPFPSLEQ